MGALLKMVVVVILSWRKWIKMLTRKFHAISNVKIRLVCILFFYSLPMRRLKTCKVSKAIKTSICCSTRNLLTCTIPRSRLPDSPVIRIIRQGASQPRDHGSFEETAHSGLVLSIWYLDLIEGNSMFRLANKVIKWDIYSVTVKGKIEHWVFCCCCWRGDRQRDSSLYFHRWCHS